MKEVDLGGMDVHFNEVGVTDRSIHYFNSPSDAAKKAYYHINSIGHFFCEAPYLVHRMCYNSFLAALVVDGCLILRKGACDIPVLPGGLMLVDCYQEHCYYTNGSCEFYFMHFAGPGCRELIELIYSNSGAIFAPPLGHPFLPMFQTMIELCSKSERPSEVDISVRLYTFLCELSRRKASHSDASQHEGEIEAIIKYIHEHLSEPLTLKQLARATNYSQGHFNRLFHLRTGISVYHYIMLCRIDQAKHLLHTTTNTIHQIGQAAGFPSDANFIRIFTKYTGYTPSSFRKTGL